MEIEIRLDPACTQPKLTLTAAAMTSELEQLVRQLAGTPPHALAGYREETVELLQPEEILRLYAGGKKVYAVTAQGEYTLRLRLYEAEERLAGGHFVRISNSELVNLRQVRRFHLGLSGTIQVQMSDGGTTYVSRRYMPKLKQILGI